MSEQIVENKLNIEENPAPKRSFWELLPDYIFLIGLAGLIIFLDQWTKDLVRENIPYGGIWMPWEWLAPYARIVNWQNTGAAFGMFQSGGMIFTVLAVIVSILILAFYPQVPKKEWALRLAMGLQLGGALGNFTDRIQFGHVTDFVSVWDFPVFNVADSSITIGVAILIVAVYIEERKIKKAKALEAAEVEKEGEEAAVD